MVRRARVRDLAAVARLYHDVWHETHAGFMPEEEARSRTLAFFMRRMSELVPTTLVAERDGKAIGFTAWTGGLLGQFYVDRAHRGSGRVAEALAGPNGREEVEFWCMTKLLSPAGEVLRAE